MPDQFERHARSKWEWGTPAARSQERAEAAHDDPARTRTPGKKDPDLCKAAHWKGPHAPALRVRQFGWSRLGKQECHWGITWNRPEESTWICRHEEYCSGCGKILRDHIKGGECPLRHPIAREEQVAIDKYRAEERERTARLRVRNRWQPKPPVTGPQGYRKRRIT